MLFIRFTPVASDMIPPVFLLCFLVLGSVFGQSEGRIACRFQLLDESGHPTAARVRITDLAGHYYAPVGHQADFPETKANDPVAEERDVLLDEGRRFAYVDGTFTVDLPRGPIRLEAVKGFFYRMIDDTLQVSATDSVFSLRLSPYAALPAGWYSGDVHVHYINPASAMLEMKAEDLNVCNILISDFTVDHALFRGAVEPISEPEHQIYMGQEFREDRLGHVNLLNIKGKLVEPSVQKREHQYPLNMVAYDQIHDQGGHLSWAHFAAWPGLEGPLAAVLQKVDAVELLCTIDPFHAPIFADDVVPEVRMNSGLRLWYRLLNCGLQLPVTGGTDKMNNQVSVGANRVFAKVDSAFSYEAWIHALNAGSTFVSNGPFLLFTVNGQEPGAQLSGPGPYHLKAEVWSQLPIDRLEIIANGELIAEKAVAPGEPYTLLEMDFQPTESVWLAARAHQFSRRDAREGVSFAERRDAGGGPTLFNRYFGTLRPQTLFAHTSPVYLTLDQHPVRSRADALYFVQYLDNALKWLDQKGSFPDEAAKMEVLQAFQKGREAFQALVPE